MAAVVAASLLAVQQLDRSSFAEFEQWKRTFRIEFGTEAEEFYRRTIFYRNLAAIQQHNAKQGETYKMGVNQFTAYTQE